MPLLYVNNCYCEKCEQTSDKIVSENEFGEMVCEECEQNAAERAWDRFCEDFHDGGNTSFKSLQQQQIEAQKLK